MDSVDVVVADCWHSFGAQWRRCPKLAVVVDVVSLTELLLLTFADFEKILSTCIVAATVAVAGDHQCRRCCSE